MAFTAADVKKLREMTSVGMMDCKKALTETDGDMDKAVEWLREKGLADGCQEGRPHRRRGRGIRNRLRQVRRRRRRRGQLPRPTSCAKSAPFVEFVKDICRGRRHRTTPPMWRHCKALQVSRHRAEGLPRSCPRRSWSIGENMQIRRFARFDKNASVSYVHAGGKIGVLVNLEVEGGIDATDHRQGRRHADRGAQPPFLGQEPGHRGRSGRGEEDPRCPDGQRSRRWLPSREQVKEKIVRPASSTSSTKRTACCSSRSSRTAA